MVHSFKSAYQFGKEQEILCLDYVNKKFSNTYQRAKTYSHHDYRNDDLKLDIELKSRKIVKSFDTTGFDLVKLIDGRRRMQQGLTEKVIYIFNYRKIKNCDIQRDMWCWVDDGTEEIATGYSFHNNVGNPPVEQTIINVDDLIRFEDLEL